MPFTYYLPDFGRAQKAEHNTNEKDLVEVRAI